LSNWVKIAGSSNAVPVYGEVPSGTADGSNVTFVLASAPTPASSLQLFVNGDFQIQGTNYTISGATITFMQAPADGDQITAFYMSRP
jgi:hypothetical protein